MVNLLHDIKPGDKAPEKVKVVIEVPKQSTVKYEVDKETGLVEVDRVLYSPMYYPADYGFIPRTHWDDGDPLDVLIISNFPVQAGVLAVVRPVGILEMIDDGDEDDTLIAIYDKDPRFKNITTLEDLPEHTLKEIKHFFSTYKDLQGKEVNVKEYKGVEEAKKAVEKGIKQYKEHF